MFSELESILKQYCLYTEEKEIKHELLVLSSIPLDFEGCESLIEKKYVYILSGDLKTVMYLLFSDQCMLSNIARIKKKYTTFFDLLINEIITLDDYDGNREKEQINWLIENEWLSISNERIVPADARKIEVLYDLYLNEFLSYWHYREDYRKIIDKFISENLVTYESSLFSKSEQDYFSYYFNNKRFTNALALRNKYGHGTIYGGSPNSANYFRDYLYSLRLLVLATIKINDDLCLFNSNKYQNYIKSQK